MNGKKEKNVIKQKDLMYFTSRRTSTVKFNTSFVKLANMYAIKNTYMKFLIAAASGLLMSIITIFLVEVTGLYTGGTTAFFQGLARFFYSLISVYSKNLRDNVQLIGMIYNLMFWGFYLFVNIPLLLFAYFKLNKRFALLSATYLVTMQVCGFLWSFIPGIHNVMLFGDTATVDLNLRNFNIQCVTFAPNVFPSFPEGSHLFDWTMITSSSFSNSVITSTITSQNVTEFFLLVVYALVFSFFSSFFGSVMYMISGSTAGGDIITIYYSQEKHKNLGMIMIIYNSIMMILGVLFGSYLSGVVYGNSEQFGQILASAQGINGNPYVGWQYIISGNLIASFVWVMAHGMLIDRLFPWHKMVRVEIFTKPNKVRQINNRLKHIKYTHPTTITKGIGGYSKKDVDSMVTIMQCIELPEFIQIIRQIDDKCLISTIHMSDLDGFMTVQKQTC